MISRAQLAAIAAPAGVAVIGASDDVSKMGGASLRNLLTYRYKGALYPVNKTRDVVQGLRAYRSIADCSPPPDTVVVAVPAADVPRATQEAAEAGIRSVTVISAGFSEGAAGPEGMRLHEELHEIVEAYGLALLGPNTTGLANFRAGYVPRAVLNSPDDVRPSDLAIVTQSGALSNVLLCRSYDGGFGVGFCVATGDEMCIRVDHWLDFLADDRGIGGVICVVEGLRNGPAFAAALQRLRAANKPCAVLKIGRSEAGSAMAMTHTGALAGDAEVFDSVVTAAGGLVASGIEQVCQLGGMAAWLAPHLKSIPAGTQLRVGLVCGSGGEAALLADRYSEVGVALPPVSARFENFVRRRFAYGKAGNPFDLTGEVISTPALVADTARHLVNEPVHVAHLAFPTFRDELGLKLFNGIGSAIAGSRVPVVISTWSCRGLTEQSLTALRKTQARVVERSELVPECLASITRWIEASPGALPTGTTAPRSREYVNELAEEFPTTDLGMPQLVRLLTALGLEIPRRTTADDLPDRLPPGAYFVKGYKPGIFHKKAAGLVEGPLTGRAPIAAAIAAMRSAHPEASIEVERAVAGFETLIGLRRDSVFGWSLIVGLGGLATEAFGAPILINPYTSKSQASELVRSGRAGQVLLRQEGARGEAALALLVGAIGRLMAAADEVTDRLGLLEVNPVIVDVGSGTCWAVDAVGLVRAPSRGED